NMPYKLGTVDQGPGTSAGPSQAGAVSRGPKRSCGTYRASGECHNGMNFRERGVCAQTRRVSVRLCCLDRGRQRRHDLERIAHDTVIRNLEDRCFLVLVDRDDRPCRAHTGEVLNGPGYSDGDVQLRTYLATRLTDLIRMRPPPVVRDGARRTHGSIPESRGKILDELEILRGLESATAGDDDLRIAEID